MKAGSTRRSPPSLGAAQRAMWTERGETQRATVEAAGITVAHLSKIEHGRTNRSWASVVAIARALGVTVPEAATRFEAQT